MPQGYAPNPGYVPDHDHHEDYRSYGFNEHVGETVTIFTTSGGPSGAGFTGVILFANECFVRLVTRIGPPPGCALGNACCPGFNYRWSGTGNLGGTVGTSGGFCCRRNYNYINTVGSVVDIPLDRIASIVYNSV